jgi:hypothetical protein
MALQQLPHYSLLYCLLLLLELLQQLLVLQRPSSSSRLSESCHLPLSFLHCKAQLGHLTLKLGLGIFVTGLQGGDLTLSNFLQLSLKISRRSILLH